MSVPLLKQQRALNEQVQLLLRFETQNNMKIIQTYTYLNLNKWIKER